MHHHQDKKIAILLADMYEDQEFWFPYFRLKEAGADVVVIGSKAGETYKSKHGYPAKADKAPAEVDAQEFDALIIPGGFGPDFMRRDDLMVDFVRACTERDMPIAAICHGVWMLCCTDALRGKRATSYFSIRWDVQNAGATWVDEMCVADGNIITSRNPDDLPAFCNTILQKLQLVDEFAEAMQATR